MATSDVSMFDATTFDMTEATAATCTVDDIREAMAMIEANPWPREVVVSPLMYDWIKGHTVPAQVDAGGGPQVTHFPFGVPVRIDDDMTGYDAEVVFG